MWKRLTVLWTVLRGDAWRLWFAVRHPAAPAWLKLGTALIVLYPRVARPTVFSGALIHAGALANIRVRQFVQRRVAHRPSRRTPHGEAS